MIYGISDLHLSFQSDKPMDVFGRHWRGHAEKMAKAWDERVQDDDIVLLPGDLSWAMRLDEAALDLAWMAERKGRLKILSRGNHDYWWSAIGKVRSALPESLVALQNDAIDLGDVVLAAARCWAAPGALDYTSQDRKIYEREVKRLELSLTAAKKMANGRDIIAQIHYPPFTAKQQPTRFAELLTEAGVKLCVYGHLHGRRSHRTALQGNVEGVEYRLIACDHLDFSPIALWPPEATEIVHSPPASNPRLENPNKIV